MVVFHVLICVLLVIVILMQSAKGEGLAGAFGGGGGGLSGAVFGGRGAATFLSKATTVLAVVFMINCGILAFMSGNRSGGSADEAGSSIVTEQAQREMEQQAAQQQMIPPDSAGGDLFQTEQAPAEGTTGESNEVVDPAEPVGAGGN
jgi:preprotein translocase subunit SecG